MRNRYDFISAVSVVIVFVLLEAVSYVLIANNSIVQRFRLVGAVRGVQAFFWDKGEKTGYYFDFRKENERLLEENLALKQKLDVLSEFVAGADSIAVDMDSHFTYKRARVVRNSVNKQHNSVIIDKGELDGVKNGMGVVTNEGLVGIVDGVGSRYSRVISFLNTEQSVSARLSESGLFGPMSWKGTFDNRAILRDIPIHAQVAVGDTVLSSGFSSMYPPDIPLGVVVGSKQVNGVTQDIEIDLFENYSALRFVYIVESNIQDEISELERYGE